MRSARVTKWTKRSQDVGRSAVPSPLPVPRMSSPPAVVAAAAAALWCCPAAGTHPLPCPPPWTSLRLAAAHATWQPPPTDPPWTAQPPQPPCTLHQLRTPHTSRLLFTWGMPGRVPSPTWSCSSSKGCVPLLPLLQTSTWPTISLSSPPAPSSAHRSPACGPRSAPVGQLHQQALASGPTPAAPCPSCPPSATLPRCRPPPTVLPSPSPPLSSLPSCLPPPGRQNRRRPHACMRCWEPAWLLPTAAAGTTWLLLLPKPSLSSSSSYCCSSQQGSIRPRAPWQQQAPGSSSSSSCS
mmetsp:Transcript_10121/g.21651  ORF Transcript_10121/g.21651 Transcript_10121/m.21651 type:complete len:295 (+) Transcript_10121:449-1333(+)